MGRRIISIICKCFNVFYHINKNNTQISQKNLEEWRRIEGIDQWSPTLYDNQKRS